MKGIVFTEFLEFVENQHGIVMVDTLINDSQLSSGGVYSSVGNYSHFEMVELVSQLSKQTSVDINTLLKVYGEHFFSVLLASYPVFFENKTDCFLFLSTIDSYIHPEVLKLYPLAELPEFIVEKRTDNELVMLYKSSRAMYSFAEGLMKGCVLYFKVNATITLELLEEDGTLVRFRLLKK